VISAMKNTKSIFFGLSFGDEGKGTMVDAWARHTDTKNVVRFNGGPQAAHYVVTSKKQTHCFSQFGAATLVPGVKSFASRFMLVDPLALGAEAEALARIGAPDALARLTIDAHCVVVTPFHKLLNRLQEEARGKHRHGSCGVGVGQAYLDSLNPQMPSVVIRDLFDEVRLRKKLRLLQLVKIDQAEQLLENHPDAIRLAPWLEELKIASLVDEITAVYLEIKRQVGAVDEGERLSQLLASGESVAFEGAQGVLLDADRGFWPHVTPSYTSTKNARTLLQEANAEPATFIGILRAYSTRHGAGPFVVEDTELTPLLPEQHNVTNRWQGSMRVGWFDAVMSRYALDISGGVDALAITNLDRLAGFPVVKLCTRWKYNGEEDDDLATFFEYQRVAGEIIIEKIKVTPEFKREHQGELTERLTRCTAVTQELRGWSHLKQPDGSLSVEVNAFIEAISSELQRPIKAISLGPTAEEKMFFL
jgi:adenylosuccinate synthase